MELQIERADPGSVPSRPAIGFSRRKGKAHVLQRLVAGFTVIILVLLGVDGFIGFWGAKSVRTSLQALIDQQMITERLVEQLQEMEVTLRSIEYGLFSSGFQRSDAELQVALERLQGSLAKPIRGGCIERA